MPSGDCPLCAGQPALPCSANHSGNFGLTSNKLPVLMMEHGVDGNVVVHALVPAAPGDTQRD